MTFDDFLSRFDKKQKSGAGWMVRCPAHADRTPSLSVKKTGHGYILLHCFAGCKTKEIVSSCGLTLADLSPFADVDLPPGRSGGDGEKDDAVSGLRLEDYLKAKKLDRTLAETCGLSEIQYRQGSVCLPAVRIPYFDPDENPVRSRVRLSLGGKKRFVWEMGPDSPSLYGLWLLRLFKNPVSGNRQKYVLLVEGESDCHAGWQHGLPVIGVPGALMWQKPYAGFFDEFDKIYVWKEPGKAGREFVRKIWESWKDRGDGDRLFVVEGPVDSAKDLSDLHIRSGDEFAARFEAALRSARPAEDILDDFPSRLDLFSLFSVPAPKLDFVLPGLLAGSVGSVVAAGGTGKSLWALQAAIAVSGGPDTLEIGTLLSDPLPPGKVVFLTAEDPPEVIHGRIWSIRKLLEDRRDGTDVAGSFFEAARRLCLYPLSGYRTNLADAVWKEKIRRRIQGARLVIVDTMRRFHLLEENSSGEMAGLLCEIEVLCKETGTALLFLHHVSKASAMTGADTQQASRGSSVLTDNVRWQMNLSAMSPDESSKLSERIDGQPVGGDARRFYVRCAFSKANYTVPLPDRWFRRGEGGVLCPTELTGSKNGGTPNGGKKANKYYE
jgi:hypothetical protein